MAEHPSFDARVRALLVIFDAAEKREAKRREAAQDGEHHGGRTERAAAGRQSDRVELPAA